MTARILAALAFTTACANPSAPITLQPGDTLRASDAPVYVEVASGSLEVEGVEGEWTVLDSGARDVYEATALERTTVSVEGDVEWTRASSSSARKSTLSGTIDIVIEGNI
jgi:hypothetical protein